MGFCFQMISIRKHLGHGFGSSQATQLELGNITYLFSLNPPPPKFLGLLFQQFSRLVKGDNLGLLSRTKGKRKREAQIQPIIPALCGYLCGGWRGMICFVCRPTRLSLLLPHHPLLLTNLRKDPLRWHIKTAGDCSPCTDCRHRSSSKPSPHHCLRLALNSGCAHIGYAASNFIVPRPPQF